MNNRNGYKSLIIYQKTFQSAMSIFHLTKRFPEEERFGLTSQIRRSSRSICANIVEGYRKRICPKQFVNKLRTSDGEASETMLWFEFALACEYITQEQFNQHEKTLDEIGYMLASMIKSPEKFKPRS